jgi:hypothetical protein
LGRPLFQQSLARHFGWSGLLLFGAGVVVAGGSLFLGIQGWTLTQLWLYYLTSACLALVGIQLAIAWVQMQVLDTLRLREDLVADDLRGKEQLPQRAKSDGPRSMQPQVVR